ncbi:OmpA family protein [Actinoplanes oblitus]|uniref:OmpA family protein n=1 Tax=Actinoplanes oblitus TaxID=3040509 RepID=A0ABY8WLP8_9ACTN|nr:OmpA family protein [Actinoplanes oblitus]WIM98573.1 OmpA family protein [Actinoplanes oblitus]
MIAVIPPGTGRRPRLSGRTRRQLAVLLPLAGLAALLTVQLGPNRHRIENDLTRRSEQALIAAGQPPAEVSFTGRDGVVVAGSPADADRAREIVAGVTGVRTVRTEVVPTGPAPTPPTDPTRAPPTAPTRAPSTDRSRGLPSSPPGPARTPPPGPARTPPPGPARTPPPGPARTPPPGPARTPPPGPARTPPPDPARTPPPGPTRGPSTDLRSQLAGLPPLTFRSDDAGLTAESREVLHRIAVLLQAHPRATIRLDGHTDSRGSRAANLRLSRQRAESVRAGLRAEGVAADRLTVAGFGETRPEVADDTPAHRARNRRVELTVTG